MKKFRGIFLKNENEVGLMRQANSIVARILDALGAAVKPGVETMFFEDLATKMCDDFGVKPAFKGYHGYPYTLCCSVNEEVVHGFPSKTRILHEGDIVSFDMGVVFRGFYGDSARTYAVGGAEPEVARLLTVTRDSLMAGIEQAKVGNHLHDVSAAIQEVVEQAGFHVVRRFVGHGIGRSLHEKPEVPNFVANGLPDIPLKQGMVLAIEPMVTMGSPDVEILADRWTAVTRDGSMAAHFEHTVAITAHGPYILSVTE